jgi:hypothetical protein
LEEIEEKNGSEEENGEKIMKKINFVFLTILLTAALWAEKVAVFDDIIKPAGFYLTDDQIFFVEFPHIYVYSFKDFTLIKKFGQRGEGPAEFIRFARLHIQPDSIIVHSQTRFSYFTRDFKYIKEVKVPIQFNRGAGPMGNQVVVSHTVPGKENPQKFDLTVNLYDANFKKVKEIFRQPYYFYSHRGVNVIYLPEVGRRTGIRFFVHRDKIFIEGEDGVTGNIYVFNKNGEKINTIKLELERLKVTDEHIKAVVEWHRVNKRRLYDIVKRRKRLYTPDFFPAIRSLKVGDDKIYVIPYKKKKGKNRLFIFNLEGKLLKEMDAPIKERSIFSFYPFGIEDGKIFQLLENEDEKWELHVTDIQ